MITSSLFIRYIPLQVAKVANYTSGLLLSYVSKQLLLKFRNQKIYKEFIATDAICLKMEYPLGIMDFYLTQYDKLLTPLMPNDNLKIVYSSPNKSQFVDINHFEIISLIGRGASSEVFQIREKSTAMIYAMKAMKLQEPQSTIDQIINERKILADLTHPFIVELYYAFQSPKYIFLVLDYCAGGELFYYINRFKKLNEAEARFVLCEIILAIEYLHAKGILYRDIKVLHSIAREYAD
jgi:serine/threonine protein kinase